MIIRRGDVFYADLRPGGWFRAGRCPSGTDHTERYGQPPQPYGHMRGDHVPHEQGEAAHACGVAAYTTDMMKDSVILLEQLRTVDKTRLKEKVCHLSHEYLEQVDRALMVSLELDT